MGLIKTTLPPMASNVLGVELSQIEGTKVLEAASQTNFCGLIDMLSLVAVRANEIFSGILEETKGTVERFDNLHSRVNALTSQMAQVDDFFQQTTFETLAHNSRAYYHSTHAESSRMLTSQSRPAALQEVYQKCRRPPNLEKLDALNDPPGTSCLKLYSDPDFFEAEWIMEMEKQRVVAKAKRKERKKKRAETALEKKSASAVKVEAKPVMRARYDPHTGQRIDTVERGPSSSNLMGTTNTGAPAPSPRGAAPTPVERGASVPSLNAPPPTTSPRMKPPSTGGSLTRAQAGAVSSGDPHGRGSFSTAQPPTVSPRVAPAPPPSAHPAQHRAAPPNLSPPLQPTQSYHPPPTTAPPPALAPASRGPPPSPSLSHHPTPPTPSLAPPPPPPSAPPPPPAAPAPPPPPAGGSSLASALAAKGNSLRPTEDAKAKPVDAQSELLNQIKKGMNLNKTAVQTETEKKEVVDNSVAAILARRIAIADSDDDEDEESDEWSE